MLPRHDGLRHPPRPSRRYRRVGTRAQGLRRVSGNLRRPYRYNRWLLRVFYLAAEVAAQNCPVSRQYYQRKRSEGKIHKQAVLALVRRRLNVLWALLRDGRTFERRPPVSHTAAA